MSKIVELVDKFWETHEATEEDEGRKWFADSKDARQLQGDIWDDLFIGSGWNPEGRAALQKAGYRCWVGDGDSFGILVAVITKDGKNLSIG